METEFHRPPLAKRATATDGPNSPRISFHSSYPSHDVYRSSQLNQRNCNTMSETEIEPQNPHSSSTYPTTNLPISLQPGRRNAANDFQRPLIFMVSTSHPYVPPASRINFHQTPDGVSRTSSDTTNDKVSPAPSPARIEGPTYFPYRPPPHLAKLPAYDPKVNNSPVRRYLDSPSRLCLSKTTRSEEITETRNSSTERGHSFDALSDPADFIFSSPTLHEELEKPLGSHLDDTFTDTPAGGCRSHAYVLPSALSASNSDSGSQQVTAENITPYTWRWIPDHLENRRPYLSSFNSSNRSASRQSADSKDQTQDSPHPASNNSWEIPHSLPPRSTCSTPPIDGDLPPPSKSPTTTSTTASRSSSSTSSPVSTSSRTWEKLWAQIYDLKLQVVRLEVKNARSRDVLERERLERRVERLENEQKEREKEKRRESGVKGLARGIEELGRGVEELRKWVGGRW